MNGKKPPTTPETVEDVAAMIENLAEILHELNGNCPECNAREVEWLAPSTAGEWMRVEFRDRAGKILIKLGLVDG
jgi:hypothetical protein